MENNSTENDTIEKRLRFLRKRSGKTLTEVANAMELTGQAVGNWENGSSKIPAYRIPQICSFYGARQLWLETGEGPVYVSEIGGLGVTPYDFAITAGLDSSLARIFAVVCNMTSEEKAQLGKFASIFANAILDQERQNIDERIRDYAKRILSTVNVGYTNDRD